MASMTTRRVLLAGIMLLLALAGGSVASATGEVKDPNEGLELDKGAIPVLPPQDPVGEPEPFAGSSCPDFRVCFWNSTGFSGSKQKYGNNDAGIWYSLQQWDRSAKNRFGSRRVRIGDYVSGDGIYVVDCLNPGDNNSNLPLRADSFKIGVPGNGC